MNKKIKELIPYIVIIICVVLIRTYLVTPARVDGESMENTLYDGEIVLLNKIGLRLNGLNRFDVVVFKYEEDLLIKRVIGLPGDIVEYLDNELYINYKKVDVPFLKASPTQICYNSTHEKEELQRPCGLFAA